MLVFVGILALVALVDYIEMMRKTSGMPIIPASVVAQTSLFRVPQIAERIMPFSVLIAAMSCYLNLSRRLELVVARAAGMSAWQFVTPALIVALVLGVLATLVYNPVAAALQERSKRLEVRVPRRQAATPACRTPATVSGCASATTTASRSSTR